MVALPTRHTTLPGPETQIPNLPYLLYDFMRMGKSLAPHIRFIKPSETQVKALSATGALPSISRLRIIPIRLPMAESIPTPLMIPPLRLEAPERRLQEVPHPRRQPAPELRLLHKQALALH